MSAARLRDRARRGAVDRRLGRGRVDGPGRARGRARRRCRARRPRARRTCAPRRRGRRSPAGDVHGAHGAAVEAALERHALLRRGEGDVRGRAARPSRTGALSIVVSGAVASTVQVRRRGRRVGVADRVDGAHVERVRPVGEIRVGRGRDAGGPRRRRRGGTRTSRRPPGGEREGDARAGPVTAGDAAERRLRAARGRPSMRVTRASRRGCRRRRSRGPGSVCAPAARPVRLAGEPQKRPRAAVEPALEARVRAPRRRTRGSRTSCRPRRRPRGDARLGRRAVDGPRARRGGRVGAARAASRARRTCGRRRRAPRRPPTRRTRPTPRRRAGTRTSRRRPRR